MPTFFDFDVVPVHEVLIRVALAALFGLVLGLDRERKRKPIDFRAFMIVCVATCIVAIMAQELFADYRDAENTVRLDFMRIIEGVLTGIGFLGAGAIIRLNDGEGVRGTATGASIWTSGVLGLTLGFGFYGLAFIGFVAMATILVVLGFLRPQLADKEDHGA
ncbi:MgtC/SapB family protein [Marivibrio halodurans]|uniref:Protein MgtC n=1 Tax=Marivibrio halodurans TaxID=2039722 RepID=A0A8J7V202_9PROT|nr:MgtC/SapB family protein [Marivibrio halodurans]MBP5856875.1 MgtC/SapB family protein [Marivibrio halodurans]